MRSSGLVTLWLLLSAAGVAAGADVLPKQLEIVTSPIITLDGRAENISICFADCDSCQVRTGECEKCFAPWFELNGGQCQLSSQGYFRESTEEEQRWQNFIASSEWLYQDVPAASRQCVPAADTLAQSFSAIGPFGSGNVVYQRTISQHSYFGLKFLLIMSNWTTPQSSLRIRITNQNGILISSQLLTIESPQIRNSRLQQLCSGSSVDRRASITLEVRQQQSSLLVIQFAGNMEAGATWSLSSFVLVTGSCHPNCASCSGFTPGLGGCDICRNFLANNDTSGQKCSTCLSGFALSPAEPRCSKCPIQFKQCRFNESTTLACQYPAISNLPNNCSLVNASFLDTKQITEQTFFGSLYTIQNRGSLTRRCGAYSVVGPANFGDVITRTFLVLPPHIELSINFNIFIFDQEQSIQRYSLVILLDGQAVVFPSTEQSINITGTSNECNLNASLIRLDAIRTFDTQTFIRHKKTDNVGVGISLGSSAQGTGTRWGLRDVRLVFRRCDANCEVCTESGCQRCRGLLQLKDLECSDCLVGTGRAANSSVCVPCPQNCQACSVTGNRTTCTNCSEGYYIYESNTTTTCELNPTYGTPILGRVAETGGCNVTIPASPANKTISFDVIDNRAKRTFPMPAGSTGKSVSFYLMRLDNWEGDFLDIYLNDLLVKRLQMGSSGSTLCGNSQENDEITLQQFVINDDNSSLTIELEAVQANTSVTRRFGVASLRVHPIGCRNCQKYDFQFKTKYNYDERLFVELAFNLVYVNNNPQQFQNIFRLKLNGRELKYDIVANDSIRYWLRAEKTTQDVIERNVTVECKYPLRVATQVPNNGADGAVVSANQELFFEGRLLQTANESYLNTKTINNVASSVLVERFSALRNREEGILGLQTFFSILTRIVVYLGFASFFLGLQTPCTHVMHNLQKIWVHIYVASLSLSPLLKTALWGFRESQDQNIAINPDQWEAGLPQYLYYDAPAQYQHYYKDITFFRHIYNVGVAFAVLLVLYVVFYFVFKRSSSTNWFLRHMKVTFVHRPLFFLNSVIFYQYFTVVLACYLQFLDLKTKTNESTFAGINAAACIIAFILATLYPVLIHIWLHMKRLKAQDLVDGIAINNRNKQFEQHPKDLARLDEQLVRYNNRYSEIFYRFLPAQMWNPLIEESEMLAEKHFFYNMFRFGDLWWQALVVVLLHYSPFAQAFLLVLTNGFHLALATFSQLNTTKFYRGLKSLELICFIVIEILIIVMHSLLKTLRSESYETLGIVAIIFLFALLCLTFVRFFYTLWRLYREYQYSPEQDPRNVIRKDQGFEKGWTQNYQI